MQGTQNINRLIKIGQLCSAVCDRKFWTVIDASNLGFIMWNLSTSIETLKTISLTVSGQVHAINRTLIHIREIRESHKNLLNEAYFLLCGVICADTKVCFDCVQTKDVLHRVTFANNEKTEVTSIYKSYETNSNTSWGKTWNNFTFGQMM